MIIGEGLRKLLGTQSELPPKPFNSPVFITGCMRSGTTMLVNKLTQHPELLKVGGELNNIWTEIGGAPINGENLYRDESHADFRFSNNMTSYFQSSIIDAKSFKRHAMRAIYKWKTGGGRISYDWDNLRVVNKSPHLMNKTRYIRSIYPDAKIILIVRPIEEQVASLKMHYLKSRQVRAIPTSEKESWRNPSNREGDDLAVFPNDFKALPLMWTRLNKIALEDLSSMPNDAYHIINYHDFLNKQGEVLKSLFEFLGLSENHIEEEKKIISQGIKVFNTSTSGDPTQKWMKHLSDSEKKELDEVIMNKADDIKFINNSLKKR